MDSSSSSDETLISDLACEACLYKISKLQKANDNSQVQLTKVTGDLQIIQVDMKEKESELYRMEQEKADLRIENLHLIHTVQAYDEKLKLELESSKKREDELANQIQLNKRVVNTPQNNIMNCQYNTEIEFWKTKHFNLTKELEIVKEEARNAVHEYLGLVGEKDKLRLNNESLFIQNHKFQQMIEDQQILTNSLQTELQEVKMREINLKSRFATLTTNGSKISQDLLVLQAENNENKRQFLICEEKYRISQHKLISLEQEINKLQNKPKEIQGNGQIYQKINHPTIESKFESIHKDKAQQLSDKEVKSLKAKIVDKENVCRLNQQLIIDKDLCIQDLSSNLKRISQENEYLKEKLATKESKISDLVMELKLIENQFHDKSMKFDELDLQRFDQTFEIEKLHREIEKLTTKLIDSDTKLEQQKKSMIEEEQREDKNDTTMTSNPSFIVVQIPARQIQRIKVYEKSNTNTRNDCRGFDKAIEIKDDLIRLRNKITLPGKNPSIRKCNCIKRSTLRHLNSLIARQQTLLHQLAPQDNIHYNFEGKNVSKIDDIQ